MPFPPNVKEDALVACGRCCSICHKFCGIKIEVHHIRENSKGGDSTADNAIPVCFDCHADMRSYDHKHPKGNKYSERELKQHRDNWYAKVKGNIGLADRETVVDTDKQVYCLLVKALPWDGSIGFIRTHHFAGSFRDDRLDDFYEFKHRKNPAFQFIDPDLEALRANLMDLIDAFALTIARETFSTQNVHRNSVPQEWEIHQPERFEKAVTELNGTAERVVETYGALVKTATRKLGMLPPTMAQQETEGGK